MHCTRYDIGVQKTKNNMQSTPLQKLIYTADPLTAISNSAEVFHGGTCVGRPPHIDEINLHNPETVWYSLTFSICVIHSFTPMYTSGVHKIQNARLSTHACCANKQVKQLQYLERAF